MTGRIRRGYWASGNFHVRVKRHRNGELFRDQHGLLIRVFRPSESGWYELVGVFSSIDRAERAIERWREIDAV